MTTSSPDEWPRTLDAAVQLLVSRMSEEDKERVKSTAEGDLIMFHFGWDTGIRNDFGRWAGNSELLEACGCWEPDDASGAIIQGAWNRLNGLPVDWHQRGARHG